MLINDPCGTTTTKSIFCTNVTPLQNTKLYTFSVRAHNAVGLSDAVTDSTTPSINNSASQINSGNLSQQTGNGANPTAGDPIITKQTFGNTTAGIGLLQEQSNRGNTFCEGQCIGGTVLVNKLKDPNAPTGFYQVNVLYYKTLINGTGIKVKVYFAPNDTDPTGSILPLCPANVANITTDCAIVKLGNQGANPALQDHHLHQQDRSDDRWPGVPQVVRPLARSRTGGRSPTARGGVDALPRAGRPRVHRPSRDRPSRSA